MDSLGFIVHKNPMYAMESKIRDNCYVVFILGTIIDHLLSCFAVYDDELRCNYTHNSTSKWVEQVIQISTDRDGLNRCALSTCFICFIFLRFQIAQTLNPKP